MQRHLNDLITHEIVGFVKDARSSGVFRTRWQEPLVGFADAGDPLFSRLRESGVPDNALPRDLLADAWSFVVYFLPFERDVPLSNRDGRHASRQWALAYLETNTLIISLNEHLSSALGGRGISSAGIPPTRNFDPERLVSRWSHRHVGWIAGLGTFGANRMLITEKGCCGRLGSLVIAGECTPSTRPGYEFCLNAGNRHACLACVKRCPSGALNEHSFDRRLCHSLLLENARMHGGKDLADVCGKCLTGVPCSHENPAGRSVSRREIGRAKAGCMKEDDI